MKTFAMGKFMVQALFIDEGLAKIKKLQRLEETQHDYLLNHQWGFDNFCRRCNRSAVEIHNWKLYCLPTEV